MTFVPCLLELDVSYIRDQMIFNVRNFKSKVNHHLIRNLTLNNSKPFIRRPFLLIAQPPSARRTPLHRSLRLVGEMRAQARGVKTVCADQELVVRVFIQTDRHYARVRTRQGGLEAVEWHSAHGRRIVGARQGRRLLVPAAE